MSYLNNILCCYSLNESFPEKTWQKFKNCLSSQRNLPNLKQNLFELDVYGFTILEEVLSPDDVSAMKEALIQLCNLHGEDRGNCIHISNLLVRDPIFFQSYRSSKSIASVGSLYGTCQAITFDYRQPERPNRSAGRSGSTDTWRHFRWLDENGW